MNKSAQEYLDIFVELIYTLPWWKFNEIVHHKKGGDNIAEMDIYGTIPVNLSYSYWALVWTNITKLNQGNYKVKSNSTVGYDVDKGNDAKIVDLAICDDVEYGQGLEAYPSPNNISVHYPGYSKVAQSFTLHDESIGGRTDDRFLIEDVSFDCGGWADCSKAFFDKAKVGQAGLLILTNFTFKECPEAGKDYEMEMTVTFDDNGYYLDCVDNEKKTFKRIVNFVLHERCFCEEFIPNMQGECDQQNEAGCWSVTHSKCCGDNEGETWTLQSNRSLDPILPDGTCFDGAWNILTQKKVAYYDLFE